MHEREITRRELIRRGGGAAGLLALPAVAGVGSVADAVSATAPSTAPLDPYTTIGVRALSTRAALHHHQRLDDAVRGTRGHGRRPRSTTSISTSWAGHRRQVGELTKAEWGLVTSGCSAALTHATAAASPAAIQTCTSASRTWQASRVTRRSSPRTRATCTTPPYARSASASSKSRRSPSSRRPSARARRWSTFWPAQRPTRAR